MARKYETPPPPSSRPLWPFSNPIGSDLDGNSAQTPPSPFSGGWNLMYLPAIAFGQYGIIGMKVIVVDTGDAHLFLSIIAICHPQCHIQQNRI